LLVHVNNLPVTTLDNRFYAVGRLRIFHLLLLFYPALGCKTSKLDWSTRGKAHNK